MGEVERRRVVGAVARHGHHLAALLQQAHQTLLVQRPGPRKHFELPHAGKQLFVARRSELRSRHAMGVAIDGIVPQPDSAGDFAGRGRRVARHYLDADTGLAAALHRRRNLFAHGVGDGCHGRKAQSAPRHSLRAGDGVGLGPGNGERAHGAALEFGQLAGDALLRPIICAERPHDFGRPFDAKQTPPRNAAADEGRHVFALGREGEPVDDFSPGPQRIVGEAALAQPGQQCPFGRIAEDAPLGIEKRCGVGRHDLGETGVGEGIAAHELLDVHAVLREGAGLVGADDRHGAHRLAGVHPTHQVVSPEHAPHRHGERQGDTHGQPFGYGHDDDGHRNHEEVQHLLRDREPILPEQVGEKQRLAEEDAENDDGQTDADAAYQLRKARQLAVERRGLLARGGGLLGHAPGLGAVAHGGDD